MRTWNNILTTRVMLHCQCHLYIIHQRMMSRFWLRSNWLAIFPRPRISPSIATEAFQAVSLVPVVGGRVCKTFGTRGGRQSTPSSLAGRTDARRQDTVQPGLFTTGEGMTACIQWRCIPERSHRIHKVMYSIKSGSIPDPVPPVHCQRP